MKQEDKELLKKKAAAIVEDVFDKAKGETVLRVTALIEENVVVEPKVNQDKLIADVVEALQKNGVVDVKYFEEADDPEPKAPEYDTEETGIPEEPVTQKDPVYNPYAD